MKKLKALYAAFCANDHARHAQLLTALIRSNEPDLMATIQGHVLADDWLDFCHVSLQQQWDHKRGFLYVVRNPVTPDFLKVGKTRLSVTNRLRKLNNEAVVGQYICVQEWPVHDRHYLEVQAHKALSSFMRHKEHFVVNWQDACPLIEGVLKHDIAQFTPYGFHLHNG